MIQTSEKNERKKTRLEMKRKEMRQKALPTGWQEVRLGEVGAIHSGGTPSTRDDSNWDGDILWLTPSEVTKLSRKYIRSTERKITPKGLSSTTLLPPNCLIVCTRATIGHCCINVVSMAINQGFKCIQPHKDYSVTFLYYVFQLLKQQLVRLSCGNTFGEVSKKDFENILITLPPFPEQKAIASLLETWDTAIEKTEALIAAKEKRFKWLLKTLIHDQQNNPEWRKVKLGKVCTLEYGKPLKEQWRKDGKYPVFGSNGIVGYHNEYLITGPFIIVGRKGSAGMVQYSIGDGFPIDTTFYIKAQKRQICLLFLYYLLLELNLKKVGLQSGIPGLNRNDAHRIKIQLPSLSEQKRIANMLDTAKQEISLLEQIAEQYRTQKRGLMQKLLTGEWQLLPSFPRKRESRNLS